MPRPCWRASSPPSTASPRSMSIGRRNIAVRIQVDPAALAARGIGIDELAAAVGARPTSISATGTLNGAHQVRHHPCRRPARQCRGIPPADHRLSQWRAGAPAAMSADVDRQRRESTSVGELVQRPARHRAGDPAPARLQHHRRWSTRSSQVLPQFEAQLPAVDQARTCSTTAARSIRAVGRRCAVHPADRRRAGGGGDLRLPAQRLGHHHSLAGAAHHHHRHLRRHGAAGLQPRQSVADGADPVGRLCGRRRHRDAGEHRPPCRGGREALRGGDEGLARNRLHHPVHDHLAGGGVHSHRSSWAALSAGCCTNSPSPSSSPSWSPASSRSP